MCPRNRRGDTGVLHRAVGVRLEARTYSLRTAEGVRRRPTMIETLGQYVHSMNFVAARTKALHALFEVHVLALLPIAVLFALHYATLRSAVACALMFFWLSNLYNTVWYHRYCSHFAFRFSNQWFPRLFLWLNPVGYREEVYALNHHVHHRLADEDSDPYGPHIGWLGTMLASSCELDTQISEKQFERLKAHLAHVGFPFASFDSFRRWGSVESVPHYLARWLFATLFWVAFWLWVGGLPCLFAWGTALLLFHLGARDFNFRGHGGLSAEPGHVDGWDFDRSSRALNQRFYGLLAGEWHNNHHAFRVSANAGFLPGQLDLPFLIIRLMKSLGVVARYNDHRAQFLRRYLRSSDSQLSERVANIRASAPPSR
jgi:fatty-acid desaturase